MTTARTAVTVERFWIYPIDLEQTKTPCILTKALMSVHLWEVQEKPSPYVCACLWSAIFSERPWTACWTAMINDDNVTKQYLNSVGRIRSSLY